MRGRKLTSVYQGEQGKEVDYVHIQAELPFCMYGGITDPEDDRKVSHEKLGP